MRFKFEICNYVSSYISVLALAVKCAFFRRKIKVREHPDLALLQATKQTYSKHTDAIYLMKQVRDNSTVIKSLLTKQQRILTKFNSERVIDIGR